MYTDSGLSREKGARHKGNLQSISTKDSATEPQRNEIVCTCRNTLVATSRSHQRYHTPSSETEQLVESTRSTGLFSETSGNIINTSIRYMHVVTMLRMRIGHGGRGKTRFCGCREKVSVSMVRMGSVTDTSFITAGAGKSVLACVSAICHRGRVSDYANSSSVINDLDNTKKDGEILVYFYCDFRTGRSTSALEVMRSLLAFLMEQLCRIMMDPEALLDELLKGADSRVHPFYNVKALAHYLSKVARLCPRKPLVVVDALDECREVETLLDGLIMCSW
jgi:hypothetical protein